jgi:HSP20 family molecular chaperone IbpA
VKIDANFDAAAGKAAYSNGILRICVPPSESFKERLHPPSPPLGAA